MAKGTRASGDPINEPATSEVGDLRDMMQNLITEVGALAGKISSLEKLDQTVIELQSQFAASGENRRDKTPLGTEEGPTGKVQSEESKETGDEAVTVVILTIPTSRISLDGQEWNS